MCCQEALRLNGQAAEVVEMKVGVVCGQEALRHADCPQALQQLLVGVVCAAKRHCDRWYPR